MRLDMIGLIVKDMQRSLDFYRALGFSLPSSADKQDYVELVQGSVRLSFNSLAMIEGVMGKPQVTARGSKFELAFLCDSVAEIDQVHQKMADSGYKIVKAPWDTFWGQRYCILEDSDGNQVSLFCPLAG